MGRDSKIEWTDATWSPIRARVKADAAEIAEAKGYASLVQIASKMAGHVGQQCEKVSDGCEVCYSETMQARCLPKNGTGLPFDRRSRDLVDVFVDEKTLLEPLRWKRPRKIFVENQSDLFGEWVTDEMIDRVFAVMALCCPPGCATRFNRELHPEHTIQILTKRSARMRRYFAALLPDKGSRNGCLPRRIVDACDEVLRLVPSDTRNISWDLPEWPLPNVWLGVCVEDQQRADERIPLLLQTPAAVRFVSAEPVA